MLNFVYRLYDTQGSVPEVAAVNEFLNSLLGADCAGEKELTFLTLRVGNALKNHYHLLLLKNF